MLRKYELSNHEIEHIKMALRLLRDNEYDKLPIHKQNQEKEGIFGHGKSSNVIISEGRIEMANSVLKKLNRSI